jgi:putative membrane protein
LLHGPAWPCAVGVASLPVLVALAEIRYRNLGHAFADGYLVAGASTVARRRVVLDAKGIIGWSLQRTFFQRRAGLATLMATTAAGHKVYAIYDVPVSEARRFARHVRPDILASFK